MPIVSRISKVENILKSKDPSVGIWHSHRSCISIAHFYERDANNINQYNHRFCYRNFTLSSYSFDRSVEVNNAEYTKDIDFDKYEIKGKSMNLNAYAECLDKPCGIMNPRPDVTVVTSVTLKLNKAVINDSQYNPEIPEQFEINSHFDLSLL